MDVSPSPVGAKLPADDLSLATLQPRRTWVTGAVAIGITLALLIAAWVLKPSIVPTLHPVNPTGSSMSVGDVTMTATSYELSEAVTIASVGDVPGVELVEARVLSCPDLDSSPEFASSLIYGCDPDPATMPAGDASSEEWAALWAELGALESPERLQLDPLPARMDASSALVLTWRVTSCDELLAADQGEADEVGGVVPQAVMRSPIGIERTVTLRGIDLLSTSCASRTGEGQP